ncbi:hypothetical protein [Jeongeupia sp. HS-3]|uniref:hypothetical protein n=1 Tax=Jeongeupia sp. HS-3 TaxID=1009682 RepID=UPI00190FFE0C|nr:hypothetical protein [Jeongeupia sp. HS-3]
MVKASPNEKTRHKGGFGRKKAGAQMRAGGLVTVENKKARLRRAGFGYFMGASNLQGEQKRPYSGGHTGLAAHFPVTPIR